MTPDEDRIERAAAAAIAGRLIVFPTDTVYGIGARPDDAAVTGRLFEAKGRPRELELPVVIGSADEARRIAVFDDRAEALARRFWPGPLTIVVPRSGASRAWELGGDPSTIGVRMPRHPVALAVLHTTGPLAATSANRSGEPPARTCEELQATFGDAVETYLCDPEPLEGEPSTVVELAEHGWRLVREGAVSERAILEVLGRGARRDRCRLAAPMASILVVCTGNVCRSPLAEGFLREALGARSASSSIDVTSAGTMGWDGSSADPSSIEAGTERGIDISGHVARGFSTSDVREADLVLGMAPEHVEAVIRDVPDAEHKAFTLKGFVRLLEALPPAGSGDPGAVLVVRVLDADALRRSGFESDPGDDDIADPLGRPFDVFRSVAADLDEWCGRLADGLFGRAPATTSSSNED